MSVRSQSKRRAQLPDFHEIVVLTTDEADRGHPVLQIVEKHRSWANHPHEFIQQDTVVQILSVSCVAGHGRDLGGSHLLFLFIVSLSNWVFRFQWRLAFLLLMIQRRLLRTCIKSSKDPARPSSSEDKKQIHACIQSSKGLARWSSGRFSEFRGTDSSISSTGLETESRCPQFSELVGQFRPVPSQDVICKGLLSRRRLNVLMRGTFNIQSPVVSTRSSYIQLIVLFTSRRDTTYTVDVFFSQFITESRIRGLFSRTYVSRYCFSWVLNFFGRFICRNSFFDAFFSRVFRADFFDFRFVVWVWSSILSFFEGGKSFGTEGFEMCLYGHGRISKLFL